MSIRRCYARAHLVDLVASHQHVRVLTCQKDRPCRKTKYVNCGHRMNILQAVYKTVSKTNQHLCSRRAWLQSHFISMSSRPPRVWVYSACQFPSCGLENYYQDWG